MRTVKLLHLYSQTLDLYGDSANLAALQKRVEEMGHHCTTHRLELGEELCTTGYDLVYIGHGKGRNLEAVAPHFRQHREAILAATEGGQLWLATGNSRLLFGRSFEGWTGETVEGIALFDYTAVETREVIVSDVIARPVFDEGIRTYGFINRTAHLVGGGDHPLFRLEQGLGDGAGQADTEGDLYKGFFGTWQMGPLLLRNPALLRELLRRMLGEDYRDFATPLEDRALELTLKEF